MIVFNDTLGVYGGAQTLMLRMCTWLRDKKIKTTIITDTEANTEIVKKLKNLEVSIVSVDRNNLDKLIVILRQLNTEEEIKVISFVWDFYIDIELAKYKGNIQFENIMYCIHPEAFEKRNPTSAVKNFIKRPIYNVYKSVFCKMNDNNAITVMDEVDTEESERRVGVKLSNKPQIIRLPMICNERTDCNAIIDDGYNSQMILTASRAEYPYKGYVFGLIDDFCELRKENSKLKLTIVSGGGDLDKLLEKIDGLDKETKQSITLHKWMTYDSLMELALNCKLFVGMGTSVLDMALCYKPSIAVKFNTYDCVGDSLISEKPEYITTDETCNYKAVSLIKKILNLNKDEYKEESMKSFMAVKNIYDINKCMDCFMVLSTIKKESILSSTEYAVLLAMKKYIYFKTKNIPNKYDYDNLQKES
jgi:hypothetical protein